VIAMLDAAPAPAPPGQGGSDDNGSSGPGDGVGLNAGLSGERAGAWPAVLLALSCACIWLAAWIGAKIIKPWIAYGLGAPLFFLVLFFFYESFSRLLPANF
jgi:hypothetical protein